MFVCEVVETHPGIPGVDGLRGDDLFEVKCTDLAVAVAEFTDTWCGERDEIRVCQSHLDMIEDDAAIGQFIKDLVVTR